MLSLHVAILTTERSPPLRAAPNEFRITDHMVSHMEFWYHPVSWIPWRSHRWFHVKARLPIMENLDFYRECLENMASSCDEKLKICSDARSVMPSGLTGRIELFPLPCGIFPFVSLLMAELSVLRSWCKPAFNKIPVPKSL